MTTTVELSNLGPLRSASGELSDLLLLIGENNTGKTFFATVASRVLGASPVSPSMSTAFRARGRRYLAVPKDIRDWLYGQIVHSHEQALFDVSPWTSAEKRVLDWARTLTSTSLELFANNVRANIEYAFGVEASELRRRTHNSVSDDCYVAIHNTDPDWSVTVRFDMDRVVVNPPDPKLWLKRILQSQRTQSLQEDLSLFYSVAAQEGIDNGDELDFLYSELMRVWIADLYSNWPRQAVHLPAGRTGIMQSYQILAGAVVRQAVAAGIRPIEIDTLPGTAADFLSLLVERERRYYRGPRRRRLKSRDSQLRALAEKFEHSMRASIRYDREVESRDVIVVETPEGEFPLSRTSSMLSELAPMLLILKGHVSRGDHITIDEPEAHLHPAMQRRISSFLMDVVNSGIRLTLTTHSDFFVGQLNNIIRSGELEKRDHGSGVRSRVCALYFSRDKEDTCVGKPLTIDPVDGIDESSFTGVMASLYNESVDLIERLITKREFKNS